MNYATQHHFGNHQHSPTETATAIAPPVGRVRKLDATGKGRRRNTEGQAEVRTDNHASDGFLRCSFLPKLKVQQPVQACKETAKTERDFYTSLSKLAEHWSIEPMQTHEFGYPYNIALSLWDMEAKVKRTNINCDSFKLLQDSKKTYLTSEERYDVGTTLYYIPIVPLFKMLNDPKRKKTAQLIVSVCSYLYHIAHIPYYRQEDSYLYWQYEMHKDCVEQDEETDETQSYKSELGNAGYIGDRMEQKLFNRSNLKVFEQRLNRFRYHDAFDRECWNLACTAFALYTQYPKESIFRNATLPESDPYNDVYENETIGMEKYISFVADTKGWLYESLSEGINNEFNEYASIDEPTVRKSFDGSDIMNADLDFENRLFALLDDLCTLLYDYKRTENEQRK